mmetsp:Transcript_7575/g.14770  ORF Transcript_7575/g.14770 Transcript_7575/m.14770 type:complete len:222 (-) Transcript_7575:72-737(-)
MHTLPKPRHVEGLPTTLESGGGWQFGSNIIHPTDLADELMQRCQRETRQAGLSAHHISHVGRRLGRRRRERTRPYPTRHLPHICRKHSVYRERINETSKATGDCGRTSSQSCKRHTTEERDPFTEKTLNTQHDGEAQSDTTLFVSTNQKGKRLKNSQAVFAHNLAPSGRRSACSSAVGRGTVGVSMISSSWRRRTGRGELGSRGSRLGGAGRQTRLGPPLP